MIEPSKLRAAATGSGADRWMSCPASVAMCLNLKEEDKKYATEGTKAHEEAARLLVQGTYPDTLNSAVETYVRTVQTVLDGVSVTVEERLSLLGSSGGVDAYAIDGHLGFIFDFKYGIGVKLQAFENPQLAFYACALKEKYPEIKTVQVYLIQPRVEGELEDTPSISSWTLPHQTLRAWRKKFEEALVEVEKAETIRAGSWCQFCKARGGCPAHLAYAENASREIAVVENELSAIDTWPVTYVPRIAKLFSMRKRAEGFFKKAEEFLLQQALSGVSVPGFELTKKRTNRKWKAIWAGDPEELAAELIKRGVKDPWTMPEIISFTKAEELCDVSDLVEKPDGGMTLKAIKE